MLRCDLNVPHVERVEHHGIRPGSASGRTLTTLVSASQTPEEVARIARSANLGKHSDSASTPVRIHVPKGVKEPQVLIAIVDGPLQAVAVLRSFSHGVIPPRAIEPAE